MFLIDMVLKVINITRVMLKLSLYTFEFNTTTTRAI